MSASFNNNISFVNDQKNITQVFDEFAKSLSDAFKPRLVIGWYLCLLSVLACGVLVVLAKRKAQTESLDV